MNNDDFEEAVREPEILPLWLYQGPGPQDDDHQPEGPDYEDDTRAETFWAGRNLAMRRSARWAA
jgi:hypothetical protein